MKIFAAFASSLLSLWKKVDRMSVSSFEPHEELAADNVVAMASRVASHDSVGRLSDPVTLSPGFSSNGRAALSAIPPRAPGAPSQNNDLDQNGRSTAEETGAWGRHFETILGGENHA
jgi:hypothetical protein